MFCKHCGTGFTEEDKFCNGCGRATDPKGHSIALSDWAKKRRSDSEAVKKTQADFLSSKSDAWVIDEKNRKRTEANIKKSELEKAEQVMSAILETDFTKADRSQTEINAIRKDLEFQDSLSEYKALQFEARKRLVKRSISRNKAIAIFFGTVFIASVIQFLR
jgi:hypothetical protein